MLYIEEITNEEKLINILKEKYKILNKLENKSEKIYRLISKIIFFYMNIMKKTIKKVLTIEDEGIECNLLYIIIRNEKSAKKQIKKLLKTIEINNIRKVVLSEKLNQNEDLKKQLYNNDIDIVDGKILAECLIYKMVEYISSMQKRKIETYEISILINEKNEFRMAILNKIIEKCNIVNIITNKPSQFEKLKENLKEECGICLNVSTNINKSLLKSDIIINYDFVPEIYSKCNIPKNIIIFNIFENIKVYSDEFVGINITDYMIYIPDRYKNIYKKMKEFNECLFYESILLRNNTLQSEIEKKIETDNVRIRYFKGNNDKIRGREFFNIIREKTEKTRKNKK